MRFLFFTVLLSISLITYAQPQFPLLTGRVVDNANILSANTRSQLNALLAQHEQETSNQLVVVTLPTLNGYDIADYGYQLGRHWQLGQVGKDNGVLLVIAKQERKIRIEVGYGLEGALTDALSSDIIRNQIRPLFKQGDFDAGVSNGVQAILLAIKGEYQPSNNDNKGQSDVDKVMPFVMFGAIGVNIILGPLLGFTRRKQTTQIRALVSGGVGVTTGIVSSIILSSLQLGLYAAIGAAVLSFIFFGGGSGTGRRRHGGGYHSGGSWGGSRGGGGFSGGGGSFGGGGASGSW